MMCPQCYVREGVHDVDTGDINLDHLVKVVCQVSPLIFPSQLINIFGTILQIMHISSSSSDFNPLILASISGSWLQQLFPLVVLHLIKGICILYIYIYIFSLYVSVVCERN